VVLVIVVVLVVVVVALREGLIVVGDGLVDVFVVTLVPI
jgi:hypothetical protein